MATPQAGIFALGTRTHHHLEFDVHADAADGDIAAALARLSEPSATGPYYFSPSVEDLAAVSG
jgi:hypothetical protein